MSTAAESAVPRYILGARGKKSPGSRWRFHSHCEFSSACGKNQQCRNISLARGEKSQEFPWSQLDLPWVTFPVMRKHSNQHRGFPFRLIRSSRAPCIRVTIPVARRESHWEFSAASDIPAAFIGCSNLIMQPCDRLEGNIAQPIIRVLHFIA